MAEGEVEAEAVEGEGDEDGAENDAGQASAAREVDAKSQRTKQRRESRGILLTAVPTACQTNVAMT